MRRWTLLVPALLPALLLALLGPALLATAPAGAAEERSWRGLDVPYLSGGRIHFRGNAAAEPFPDPDFSTSLITVAATRHSAILQADGRTLFELPAGRGDLRLVTRRVVGVPMADPVGDWVFWTAERKRGVRLVGYDTRRDVIRRGPVLGRNARVMAVDGATVYVLGDRLRSWRPGSDVVRLPDRLGEVGLLSDVDRGRFVVSDLEDGTVRVVTADGTVLAELPEDIADTFDPTGRYLATWGDTVWDSETGTSVRLDLGRWTSAHRTWAPSGELVVAAQDDHPDRYERNPARRFACDPATGACERLPDPRGLRRYRIADEAWVPSALLQLGLLIGS